MFKSDIPLFLDSDGVLADFASYAMKHYGVLPDGMEGKEKKEFWKWVQHHNDNVEPFFLNLPKMVDADKLLNYCLCTFKHVKILTATGHMPKDVKQQKIAWYEKYYPHMEVITVRKSENKAEYVTEGAILIDDRSKSIDPWVARGGIGILHTDANSTITMLSKII